MPYPMIFNNRCVGRGLEGLKLNRGIKEVWTIIMILLSSDFAVAMNIVSIPKHVPRP